MSDILLAGLEGKEGTGGSDSDQVRIVVEKVTLDRSEGGTCVVSGWAISKGSIAQISVALGESVIGRATFGLYRPDVARAFPQYDNADRSGFQLETKTLPAAALGARELTVSALTYAGVMHSTTVQVDTHFDLQGASTETPVRPPAFTDGASSLGLHVDRAVIAEDGLLYVEGWAVSLKPILAINVSIDGKLIGPAERGRPRDDIGATYPGFPGSGSSGFLLVSTVARLGIGEKSLKVECAAEGDIFREILVPINLPRQRRPAGKRQDAPHLQYNLDVASLSAEGRIDVSGWVLSRGVVRAIDVFLDGEPIGHATHNLERPDVGNAFPANPRARNSGFRFSSDLKVDLAAEHRLDLVFLYGSRSSRRISIPIAAKVEKVDNPESSQQKFMLTIDEPRVGPGGSVAEPVRRGLTIAGWALARAQVESIEVYLDGAHFCSAHSGVRREDVAKAFPDWEGNLLSGFGCAIPPTALKDGPHNIRLAVVDKKSARYESGFSINVSAESPGEGILAPRDITQAQIDAYTRILSDLDWAPVFRMIIQGKETRDWPLLMTTLASLNEQIYQDWSLTILGSNLRRLREQVAGQFPELSGKIEFWQAKPDLTIGELAEAASVKGAFFSILTPGDKLGCDALLELALETGRNRGASFVYSDEMRLSPITGRAEAWHKPHWSPDLAQSTNYIGRLWCASPGLLKSAGKGTSKILEFGEYDLVLRLTEAAAEIRHVPKVLCSRLQSQGEDANLERGALQRSLRRRGLTGEILPGCAPGIYRSRLKVARTQQVSIIIPTCAAGGLIRECIESLRAKTKGPKFEVIIVDNIPAADKSWKKWVRKNADVVVDMPGPFNWSRFNNVAAAKARGDFLLFLNDDIRIVDDDWLESLLEPMQRPEVGVVGARLIYPDQKVQHAGMFLAPRGVSRHAFRYAAADDPGYFGLALTARNVIAVTGACLLVRREDFTKLGGFNEAHGVTHNDLDYCFRVRRAGQLVVYTPYARLIHHELASRHAIGDDHDAGQFSREWQTLFLGGDPYFNPMLSTEHDDYRHDLEPVREIYSGHPLFARESIRKILAVKLDHVGDMIMSFPALRRLKKHFPKAQLYLLTSKYNKVLTELEPCIDGMIQFDFFHPQSSMGAVEVTSAEHEKLRSELEPHHFDLAVDFRKNPETRPVLKLAGARYLAGFDFEGRFPWLDITLEWEGDRGGISKRSHATDCMLQLVEAIAIQSEPDRRTISAPIDPGPGLLAALPWWDEKPVVCMHPAAGRAIKLWPIEYFAELIDRLVDEYDIRVALIGAPRDAEAGDRIRQAVRRPDRVHPCFEGVGLDVLPELLSRCALFVGNDSGPKHIAAGLGIPTVGIHAGDVSKNEFGPMGPMAVAIQREMVCSPCYLPRAEDCPRALACLRTLTPGYVFRTCQKFIAAALRRSTQKQEIHATKGLN